MLIFNLGFSAKEIAGFMNLEYRGARVKKNGLNKKRVCLLKLKLKNISKNYSNRC